MALVFPASLLAIGILVVLCAYWMDIEHHGAAVVALLFFIMVASPLACVAYGAYGWLKDGVWASISVGDTFMLLARAGVDVSMLFEPVSWRGIQSVSEAYIDSNIGWTTLALPMPLIWLWSAITDRR